MKGKFWKKAAALALAVLLVTGGVPTQPVADMLAQLSLTASAAGGTITGSGTQQAPYMIADADDWAAFAANVNAGGSYQSAYVKLDDAFDNSSSAVTDTVGTESNPFKGTFDGNGKTLNVNIDDANVQGTAPFREIADGATIMNLKVTGSVKGTTHVAGLVGFSRTSADVTAFNTIDNCEVDVDVRVTTISGNRHMGGVVGHSTSSNLNIKNTILEGTMYNTANYAGGLLGWTDGGTVNIENCLSKVSYTGTITNGFHPVAIKDYGASVTVNTDRVYYTARPSLSSQNYIAANGVRLYSSPVFGVATTLITALDGQMYYATDADPDYSIDSAEEWDSFALSVNEGNNFQGVTVTLNADITVSTMVGTANDKFKGTFNGNGHTLNLDLTSDGDYCAPFRYVYGAKIRFLTTTGTVAAGSNKYGSGLIGNATGTPSVKGCRSNVTVTSQISGDGTHGGFVGVADSSIYFTDCLFDGTISGASTNSCGGFIGWISSGTVTYENCLMAGVMNISVDSSAVFNRFNSNAKSAFTNCYYKGSYDGMTLQGTATAASGSELKNLLGNAWKIDVDGSGVIPVTDATDIGTATVSYLNGEYDYTGNAIAINPVVTDANGAELAKTTHYTGAFALNGEPVNEIVRWGAYTYTVTAVEGAGYSGTKVCPFTVKAPAAPTGLKQTACGASSVTVTWDDVLDFNDWEVRLSDDPDFENVIDTVSVSGSRLAVFTGLEDETKYYAAVRWVKNGSAGDWSDALMCPTTTKRWIGLGEDTDKFYSLPVDCYYNYSLSEQIYTPEEIGGPGLIEALDFMILSTDNTRTFDIYMLHTSKTSFADKSDWVAVTEDDKVFSGTVTFAHDEWTTITLETPFVYNGTENLLLVFDDNTGSYTGRTYFQVITGQSQSSIYLHSDGTNADPTNPTINASGTKEYRNAVRLKIGRTDNLVATVVTGINKTYYYTGSVIEDQPTIRNFDGEELEEGVHYTKMLTLNGVPVGEIKDIGEYVYTFTAVQGGGCTGSSTYEFSVVGPPDPENLYVASYGKNFAQITWTQTGDASSWMVQYSTNPEFTTGVRTVTVNGMPEVQLTGLTPDTYYYVRVRWVIADMKSDWTDKVRFETSTKRVIGGAEDTTPQYSFLPCYVYYCYSLTQQIFTSDELGNPAAFTSIDFKCEEDTTRTLEIYLAHTDKSEFDDDEDWIIVSEDDLVFSGDVAFAANEWTTIPFDNPFAYNGTDNVVLVVADNTGTYEDEGFPFAAQDSGKSMALYDYRDNSSFHPTQTNTHSNKYVTTWRNVARINALETNEIQSATVKGVEKVYGYKKSVISVTPELYDVLGNQLEEDVDYTAALTYEGVPADEVKEIGSYAYTFTPAPGSSMTGELVFEFSVIEPPAPFDIEQTGNSLSTVTIEWSQLGYPLEWVIEYDTSDAFENASRLNVSGTPAATLTGIVEETPYYVRIKWIDGEDEGVWSDTAQIVLSFKVTIGDGSEDDSKYLPTYTYYKYSLSEQIYTADELGSAATFTGLDFRVKTGDGVTRDLSIYMAYTEESNFASSKSWVTLSDEDLVFDGEVYFKSGEWAEIAFDTPFEYDGRNNVVIAVHDHTGSYSSGYQFYVTPTQGTSALFLYNDTESNIPSPTQISSEKTGNFAQSKNVIRLYTDEEHSVIIDDTLQNGSLSADKDIAGNGDIVTITVSPDIGCGLESLTVTDINGDQPAVTNAGTNKYTFSMVRSDVTVSAVFTPRDPVTITWKDHDGTVLETDENVPFSSMPTYDGEQPAREHYSFIGWDPEVDVVMGDAVYTAVYDIDKFTVTFDEGGATTQQTIEYGSTITNYTPYKSGSVFECWTLDGEPFDPSAPITDTTTLTAQWRQANEVTVTFINGETASTQNIWEYEYAERPDDPEKDGYRFGCWVDEDGIEFDFSSRVTRDITLTAKWNEVKPLAVGTIFYIGDWIGFDGDYYYSNDKEDNPSVLFSSEAVQVKEITMLGNSYLVNMNYESNQCLLVVHTENHYENPAVKVISGDGTSYASAYKFEIVGAELDTVHTVRWVDSDGTTTLRTDENVPWGTQAVYGGDIDVPDGYFLYWNDGNKTYADANMPNVTKNVCFTAVLSTVEPIHVGSVFKAGDDVGFAYYYFNRDDEYGNVTAFNGYGIMTINSITYNSSYSQYYVTPVDALTIYVSSPADLGPNVHIKVIAGSGTSEDPFVLKAFVPNQAEPYFKVGFVSNGALVLDESVESGAVLTESNYKLTHDELIHIGWLDENGDMFDFSTPITSDMTLTAYWADPNVTYTVTFMAEDRQEVIDQADVPEGYSFGEIMNLMALNENDESMMFVGWFNEDGTKFDFNEMITHDVTVYEKWELPSDQTDHVVTFKQFDNIIFRITVEDGSVIPAMYAGFDLQITGMKQYGWKLGSSAFDFTTPITEDIALTANLIEDNTFNGHYVTFIDGDRIYGKIGVAHGAKLDESPYLVYAPENYDLDNWYYGDVPFNQVVVTEDIEVSARWVIRDNIGARLAGHNLILGDDIGVNFYMELDASVLADDGAYMLFTLPNGTTKKIFVNDVEASADTVSGKTYYIFPCEVAAKEMTAEITAQVFSGGKQGTEYRYTVKQYADYIIANPDKYSAETVELVKSMLVYGGCAQRFFEYAGTGDADADITGYDVTEITGIENAKNTVKAPAELTYYGSSLVLRSKTVYKLYFTSTQANVNNLPDLVNTSTNAVYKPFAQTYNNTVYVCYEITGISPQDIGKDISLRFGDGEMFTVNINEYARLTINDATASDNEKMLIKALYNYRDKAAAYVQSLNGGNG